MLSGAGRLASPVLSGVRRLASPLLSGVRRLASPVLRGARRLASPVAALAAGLAALLLAVAIVLSGSPQTLAGSDGIEPLGEALAVVPGGGSACQAGETLPAGVTAIRISLGATAGPRVTAAVRSGGALVARGVSGAGWLGDVVTVPVAPLRRAARDATVCFSFAGADERISFFGVPTPASRAAESAGRALRGRLAIEYARPGNASWWSSILAVARRMGLGRAWAGTWIAAFAGLLMVAAIGLASWSVVRESR